jgi:hypothetical protein
MSGQLSVDTAVLRQAVALLRLAAQQWRTDLPDPSCLPVPPDGAALGGNALGAEAVALAARRLRSAVSVAVAMSRVADHRAELLETVAASFEATG